MKPETEIGNTVTLATNMASNPDIAPDAPHEIPVELLERLHDWTQNVLALITARLPPESETLEPARHTLASGGKHIRVRLTLLSAMAAGLDQNTASSLAAAAEMVHTATLIHDDVIDGGDERRGQIAAHVVHGNKHAILGGDLLLIQALRLVHTDTSSAVATELMDIISDMVEAEYLQMKTQYTLPFQAETAQTINQGKTARLFGWCMSAPWMMAGESPEFVPAARAFGEQMGAVFQQMDDLLDLVGTSQEIGKPGLQDLREGKITSALGALLDKDPSGLARIEHIWKLGESGASQERELEAFRAWVAELDLIGELREHLQTDTLASLALLDTLPASDARNAIGSITRELVERSR